MATLPGGPSATIPLEFQGLWISRLLLEVLRGEALWVRIEPGDAVAPKAECIVCRPDGTIEAHQCKRQHGSKGTWSAADLEAEGVISAAKHYLDESPDHHFWFVSGDPAPAVRTLCERTKQFDRLHDFRSEVATNKETRRDRETLAALLGIDIAVDADLSRLRDYLQRFHPVVEEPSRQRRQVEELASRWIEGEPQLVVHALEHLANTTIRRQLDANDLKSQLEAKGFRLNDLTKDNSLPLRLNELCDRYARSFTPYLIGGHSLGREETAAVLAALDDPSTRVVLVHSSGGVGKSGVLYESLAKVRSNGVPCLAIRLDQDEIGKTPAEVGQSLGLPASPVSCLASVAGGRRAVLFIDQLDAVRWTSQHSHYALDVVVELIDAALSAQVKVVVACRTFDAHDDERIRTLFARLEAEKKCLHRIEASALSADALDGLLKNLGIAVASLTTRQRETLRSLQNVWLLAKLHDEIGLTSFVSGADLNREYWSWVRRQLSEAERAVLDDRLLPELLGSAFAADGYSVPTDLRSRHNPLIDRLLSIGALVRVGGRTIRFAHQTQFDYLAAERLLGQLRTGDQELTDWLTHHDELFHRNQLRQLLEMLRDDNARSYLKQVEAVVRDDKVRFHLKQVALEVLGSTDSPTDAELDLLLTFEADPTLSPHVRPLFGRNVVWFDLLHGRGLIAERVKSLDESTRGQALWLMRMFVEQRGEIVRAIACSMEVAARRQALDVVLQFAKVGKICDALFEEYIELIRTDSPATTHTDLKSLAEEQPRRALAVFQAQSLRVLRSLQRDRKTEALRDRIEHVLFETKDGMRKIARRLPRKVWADLWVVADHCRSLGRRWRRRRQKTKMVDYDDRQTRARLARLTEELLAIAGRSLARRRPALAWRLCQPHLNSGHRMRQRVALKSLVGLPDEYADRVLGLLAQMPGLLTCGASAHGAHYHASASFPARQMLRRFGQMANTESIASVERAVRACVPRWEREYWRFRHESFMGKLRWDGEKFKHCIFPRTIFAIQYALLSALPPERLGCEGLDWLGVLSRKFGPVESILREPPRVWGGFIGSSIPDERALQLSDRSWLRLMRSEKVLPGASFRQRRTRELVESTPELFAGQLVRAAHYEPIRFARLALRMPPATRPEYVAAIVRALGRDKVPDKGPTEWVSAPVTLTEAVLARFVGALGDQQVALDYCRLMENRADEPWTELTLGLIVTLARSHSHPPGLEATVHSGGGGSTPMRADYVATAMNCVRGEAARAIASLLFADPARLPILRPAIDAFTEDTHPSVRIAATGVALPLLNLCRNAAVEYCLKLNEHAPDEVLGGHELTRFLSYTFASDFDRLEPLWRRMLLSKDDSIAKQGAEWAVLLYLHDGRLARELEEVLKGRIAYRKATAEILTRELIDRPSDDARVIEWLTQLLNDPEKEVRDTAARLFWHAELYRQPQALGLLERFARTEAFDGNLDDVLYGLKSTTARLDTFADAIQRIVDRLASNARGSTSSSAFAAHNLPDVLLRLYEQSDAGSPARQRCLNYFDVALRDRIAHDLLPRIE